MAVDSRIKGLAAAVLLCACSGTKPDVDGELANECKTDQDCPAPNLFQCINFECIPTCRTKADCTNDVRGTEHQLSQCQGALGCQCEDFKCVGALCSADSDCGEGSACRDGACTTAPSAATVAKCQVTPDVVMAKEGTITRFSVSAWSANNEPVVVSSGITWAPIGVVTTLSGGANGSTATFTLGGPTAGEAAVAAVQATVGSTHCQASARILPALGVNEWRAQVTDELTGRPVDGATLVVSSPTTGAQIGNTVAVNKGIALFTAAGAVSVSIFHSDYTYLTIANYSAGSRDLSFVLRRNPTDKTGGYKGTLSGVPETSNVHLGLAGMSLPGSVTDLSLSQLLGTATPTDIKIGTSVDQKGVPLPAGVYLGFTDTQIKPQISAQGLAGVCSGAIGTDAETRIANGACGTRTAWALSGDIPIGELPLDAFNPANGITGLDFGKLLSKIVPLFKRFTSTVKRDVEFTLKAPPPDGGYDTSEFTQTDLPFASVPLGFGFVVRSPELPQYRGAYLDGVILLGVANHQGRGLVPLGMGAGVNTAMPPDALTDPQGAMDKGLMALRMAPTHHGLEGSEYAVVALATSLKSATDSTAGFAASGLYQRLNKLAFDPAGTTPVTFASSYLGLPDGARFNFKTTGTNPPGFANHRQFKFVQTPTLTGATVVRVLFTDHADRRWMVLMNPADVASGFVLPSPPSGLPDRTYALNNITGARSNLTVQTVKLNAAPSTPNGAALTFANLVEANDTNADRLLELTQAFSVIDYGAPTITFTTPATAGLTLPRNSDITLSVQRFKIGTTAAEEGVVRLSIMGGSAECTPVVASTDSSQGQGALTLRLPTDCTGSVTLSAQLYDQTNTHPIEPVVVQELTATIQ